MRRIARSVAALVLAAGGAVVAAAPASVAPMWSVAPSVTGAQYGILASVSCVSATSCMAVGTADGSSVHTKLAERWNGAHWSVTPGPKPFGASNSGFTSVHCLSATSCVAVGQYQIGDMTKTMVQRWDGTAWSRVPSANPIGVAVSGLAGVQCTSTTACFAVGSYFLSTPDSSAERTLVERWDGSQWKIVASPNVASGIDSGLTAISCTSATNCFAVGHYTTALVTRTLVERWNGTKWSIVASPNPSGVAQVELSGVSCPSAARCIAVGSGHGTLVERWNGTAWSIVASPNPSGATGASLAAVSCPTTTRCYAVSDYFTGTTFQRLVETYNGTSWSIVATPAPSGTIRSGLSGVSCATAVNCVAVGEYRLGPSRRPLIERYA